MMDTSDGNWSRSAIRWQTIHLSPDFTILCDISISDRESCPRSVKFRKSCISPVADSSPKISVSPNRLISRSGLLWTIVSNWSAASMHRLISSGFVFSLELIPNSPEEPPLIFFEEENTRKSRLIWSRYSLPTRYLRVAASRKVLASAALYCFFIKISCL